MGHLASNVVAKASPYFPKERRRISQSPDPGPIPPGSRYFVSEHFCSNPRATGRSRPRRPTIRRSRIIFACFTMAAYALVVGCATAPVFPPAAPSTGNRQQPVERGFNPSDIAKADVDVAAESHARECLASARLLMEKLYRRNPRELRKGNYASMDAAMARAFDAQAQFRFAELGNVRGADAIVLALNPEYTGDRVFAFGVGLASMIFLSYNGKTEFYLTDTLDAQKLYNSARNIEIAAWKLADTATRAASRCSCRTRRAAM